VQIFLKQLLDEKFLKPVKNEVNQIKNNLLLEIASNSCDQNYVISCCNEVLVNDPNNISAYHHKVLALLELDKFEVALTCCNQALEILNSFVGEKSHDSKVDLICFLEFKAYTLLNRYKKNQSSGKNTDKEKDIDNAIRCYDQLLKKDPENRIKYWGKKGVIFAAAGKSEEITNCYKQALQETESKQDKAGIYILFSKFYEESDFPKAAVYYYNEALKIDPKNVVVTQQKKSLIKSGNNNFFKEMKSANEDKDEGENESIVNACNCKNYGTFLNNEKCSSKCVIR